jgi:thiosulfate reductase cytochrome b subunit
MTFAGWVMIGFWLGFLMYGVVTWALNKSFEQLQDIENIELDELDRDNVG